MVKISDCDSADLGSNPRGSKIIATRAINTNKLKMFKKVLNDVGENWGLGLQEEATPVAAGIIDLHNYLMYYLIIIFITVFYLLFIKIFNSIFNKYGSNNWIRYSNHSHLIELIWTLIPAIILVIIAIPSFKLLYSLEADDLIKPCITLKITGNQWFWNYEISDILINNNGNYDNFHINFDSYTKSLDDLLPGELRLLEVDNKVLLPINTPIRLLITGQDVIHSFAVPSFGIKTDAVPGRINHASLLILKPGIYYGQCSELCGSAHERMSIVIEGTSILNYIKWLSTFLTD